MRNGVLASRACGPCSTPERRPHRQRATPRRIGPTAIRQRRNTPVSRIFRPVSVFGERAKSSLRPTVVIFISTVQGRFFKIRHFALLATTAAIVIILKSRRPDAAAPAAARSLGPANFSASDKRVRATATNKDQTSPTSGEVLRQRRLSPQRLRPGRWRRMRPSPRMCPTPAPKTADRRGRRRHRGFSSRHVRPPLAARLPAAVRPAAARLAVRAQQLRRLRCGGHAARQADGARLPSRRPSHPISPCTSTTTTSLATTTPRR